MNARRNFLKIAGISGISALTSIKAAMALNECDFRPTVEQPLGPFYPHRFPLDSDVDLTQLQGRAVRARGEVVVVEGVVTDEYCHPVSGAIVEIWQACHTGRYNHPSDTSGTALDPNFQYYGTMTTDSKGRYSFKTIKPGTYLASRDWRRPPHIHFKVSLRGYHELVTQLYFDGEELNKKDHILNDLHPEDRKKVAVDFAPATVDGEKIKKGLFNITLRKI